MFGRHSNINEKKTYENAIEAVETFFERIETGTASYPEVLDHLRNNVDTTEKAVEALRFVQNAMRSLIQQSFTFNQGLERYAQDLGRKP